MNSQIAKSFRLLHRADRKRRSAAGYPPNPQEKVPQQPPFVSTFDGERDDKPPGQRQGKDAPGHFNANRMMMMSANAAKIEACH